MHQGRLLELGFDAVMLQQPGGDLLQLPPESVRHLHCHPHALPDPQILPGQRSGGIE
jgi:hypothetical protein